MEANTPPDVGRRRIILRPSYNNSVFDVYVNGELTPHSEQEVFNLDLACSFGGELNVKIIVHYGTLSIDKHSAVARYNVNLDGQTKYFDHRQIDHVDWFINDKHKLPLTIFGGETIEYMHVVPSGPNYFIAKYEGIL